MGICVFLGGWMAEGHTGCLDDGERTVLLDEQQDKGGNVWFYSWSRLVLPVESEP